jgi:hypothetical protein
VTSPPKLPLLRRSTPPHRQHPLHHHRRRRRRLALARVRSAHHTRRRQTMAEERTQVSGDHSEQQHPPSATTTVVVVMMMMMGAQGVQGLSLCLPLLVQPLLTSALCESWLRVLLGSKEEEHRSRVSRCDVEGAWHKRVWPARSSHGESSMCRSSSRPNLNLKRCQTRSLRCTRSQEPSKASERPARPRAHLTDCWGYPHGWGSPKMPLLCHPLRRVSLLGHCPSPRQRGVRVEHQQRSFSRVRKSCCTST